jgi:hypothetical protein
MSLSVTAAAFLALIGGNAGGTIGHWTAIVIFVVKRKDENQKKPCIACYAIFLGMVLTDHCAGTTLCKPGSEYCAYHR